MRGSWICFDMTQSVLLSILNGGWKKIPVTAHITQLDHPVNHYHLTQDESMVDPSARSSKSKHGQTM